MKNIFILFLVFGIYLCFFIDNCFCQWQPDVRLTNSQDSSRTSGNNAWCITSSGNYVHAVWYDNRDGNNEIYYKRSTDGGINWETDRRLTNDVSISQYPSIAISGLLVHVVWQDLRDGNLEIYYKRSSDGGINWGTDIRLTNDSYFSMLPSLSAEGLFVYTVWMDGRDVNYEIYFKKSTDGGITWSSDIRLTNKTGNSFGPSVSAANGNLSVAWRDNRNTNDEIYFIQSTNFGLNWGVDTRLTNNTASKGNPSVSSSGSVVSIAWRDNRDANSEIYFKCSSNGGINWSADTRLTNNTGSSQFPSLSTAGTNVHLVWYDNPNGNNEIYYKRSTDGGINWDSTQRLSNDPAVSQYPSVSASGQVVHIVWMDNRDGNYEIYYKRNPSGNITGIKEISENPDRYILEQNYPNPFNPVTTINFNIPFWRRAGEWNNVKLTVFDFLGRETAVLVNEKLSTGTYSVNFDGSNLNSGVYFYKLTAGKFTAVKKMVLIK